MGTTTTAVAASKAYRVSRLVESVVVLWAPVKIAGVDLVTPNPSQEPNQLLVSAEVEADLFPAALTGFDVTFLRIADAIMIVRLGAISTYGAPTLLQKLGSEYAWFTWGERTADKITANPYDDAVDRDIETATANLSKDEAAEDASRHFRESLLSASVIANVFFLLRAVEALCGDYDSEARFLKADKSKLRSLLNEDLYAYFFVDGGTQARGVRNDLMHGRWVDQVRLRPYADRLRDIVLRRLRDLLAVSNADAKYRPKGLIRFTDHPMWLKATNPMPSLPELLKMAQAEKIDFYSDPTLLSGEEALKIAPTY